MDPDQSDDERYFEVLDLLGDLVWTYNGMTKTVRNGRTDYGVIGASGCRVFRSLAEKRGIFARPVSYRRKELIEDCSMSSGPVDRALKSLSEQGLVTIIRTGTDATIQLHVPPHVFALYQQSKNESVARGWGQPPLERHELDGILASLDELGFEGFAKRWLP
jgi:DNA-binding MarR family transcriptional regulator